MPGDAKNEERGGTMRDVRDLFGFGSTTIAFAITGIGYETFIHRAAATVGLLIGVAVLYLKLRDIARRK